MAFMLTSIF